MTDTPFDLLSRNSYRVKSVAARGFAPADENDLVDCLKANPDAIVIGSGHNIVLSRPRYSETFIAVSVDGDGAGICEVKENSICAYAGVSMQVLSKIACEHELTGLEVFYDIPSSLGGAVVMNAGASGEEIKSLLTSVKVFDRQTGCVEVLNCEDLQYSYRSSIFQKRPELIVISATLRLSSGKKSDVLEKMERIKAERWAKQPRDYPNAGSVFKRPPGLYVGKIVSDLELKGLKVGGAELSKKHGGFIVNVDGATGADILELMSIVKQRVFDAYGITLEAEQVVI